MLMLKSEMMVHDAFDKIIDTATEQASSPEEDMEINCVFCGILFDSVDGVEMHISEVHENNNLTITQNQFSEDIKSKINIKRETFYTTPVQLKPYFPMSLPTPEKLTVFDAEMRLLNFEQIKLEHVKLCMRCNRHFLNDDCLTQHQFSEHAIRKRKRSSHPNCVEGIVVTLEGTWSCDVCSREFATLKQAKVHKYKSHIEPAQKQEMMSNEFSRRLVNNEGNYCSPARKVYSSSISEQNQIQQYRPILPNDIITQKSSLPVVSSPVTVNNISRVNISSITNEPETKCTTAGAVDLSQSQSPTVMSIIQTEPIWKVKLSDNQDTKISLSKVVPEPLVTKADHSQKNSAFFAFNASTGHYACSHCPATFTSRAVYSRHILVHRRGKAFVCDGCGMAFTRNHTLKQHKDSKCVIANPIVGTNCQFVDQCPKCGAYFASSNSHLSHCRKICKVMFGNSLEESTKDSIKSEETSAQYEGSLEIDLEECNDHSIPKLISDFINNSSFVTKGTNEFNCNLCSCYFPSFKSIGHHLEQYHRIEAMKSKVEHISETVPSTAVSQDIKMSPVPIEIKREETWWSRSNTVCTPQNLKSVSPPPKMLMPNNFTLLPILGMVNNHEILNLSTNNVPGGIRNSTYIPCQYKPRSSRKLKIQPNANGEFECTECHKSFGCRSSLSNHIKSHFNLRNKPFSCAKCGQGFMSHVSYEEHVNSQCVNVHGTISGNNSLVSPGNGMYGSGNGVSPSTSRSTSCMHCNASFSDRSLLEDHAAREHSNENGEVQCIRCTRSFSTYMAFRVHMTKSHGGPNGTPLKNSLNMPANLPFLSTYPSLSHTAVMSSSLRYKCTNCNTDFTSSHAFDCHRITCPVPVSSNNESPVNNSNIIVPQ